ncbi:MAG: phosphate signaling complex protein PhoU [Spirochaetes bacterium]|uniref:Phosphate-specific transport system accessory protein PhoU n=1 Tax=Candidatus Ornithospirochaeta stercoripullorum TaxID=2840899 RepID=A0A9D9E3E5_9SPIO|nr:phosphate signaling complex protein PhoU [Candidatus Ornithospirochaeta stercoripullorum]
MRTRFDSELETLYVSMIKMGSLTEDTLTALQETLSGKSRAKLDGITDIAREISEKDREIEALCLRLLLRRQPVAKDLRTISSAMKMVYDIERIADNSVDIAEILPFIESEELTSRIGLDKMIGTVIEMVTGAIDAFVHSDAAKASAVIAEDDAADKAFDQAKQMVTAMIREGDKDAQEAPDLLMVAKYLERMGDHAASLARWVLNSLDASGDWLNNPVQVN